MNLRDTLHLASKLHHGSIIATTGFHIATGSQFLKHRPFNAPILCPERLALPRLIWRAIWRFLLLDALLLRSALFLRYLSGELSPSRR